MGTFGPIVIRATGETVRKMIRQRYVRTLPVVFHILSVLQQCLQLPCLMIDNRIAVVANDCYTRISIGSKLSDVDIVSRVEVAGLAECEERCSKNERICNAFTFGVGLKGNGTCAISTRVPMVENLETHPDYDVYLKKQQGSPWCDADRLYNGDFTQKNGSRLTKHEKSNKNKSVTDNGGSFPKLIEPVSTPLHTPSLPRGRHDTASYGLVGIYDLFIDHDGRFLSGDDNHRVLDILANRNQKEASSSSFEPARHRFFIDPSRLRPIETEETWNHQSDFYHHDSSLLFSTESNMHDHRTPAKVVEIIQTDTFEGERPNDKIDEKKTKHIPHSHTNRVANGYSHYDTHTNGAMYNLNSKIPSPENTTLKTEQKFGWNKSSAIPTLTICHRKLQPGKKTMELHVERVVNCENVQDCRRTCDYEKAFDCKGFNYRGGSSGSKGVCELTATPYFRMNVDRDFLTDPRYDYYERDRNCPQSMWNGGATQWTNHARVYDQNRQSGPWSRLDREDANEDLSAGLTIYREMYPNNHEFARSFPVDYKQSNEQFSQENPRSAVYDNSLHDSHVNYDKGFSSVRNSIFPKYQPEDRSLPHDFDVPQETDQYYGKFNNYGGAFGYSDNSVPPAKEFFYGEHGKSPEGQKCSIRSATGSKLNRRVLRKTCLARDLAQCEDLCINESTFLCGSFAYRYNVLTTNPTDNCLLSDLPYQDLNFYTDVEPDRDYDSYVIVQDSKVCHTRKGTHRYPAEECFSRVRSGFGIPADITKKSMLVDDLGECQFACTMSQEFVCRSFAFKYATTEYRGHVQEHASPNCFLSDWPPGEINPVNMPDMDGAELYERSSFSYGCEPYPLPLPISDVTTNDRGPNLAHTDEFCYSQHHRPCKLMSHAVVSSTRAVTKSECRQKCSTMRNTGAIPPCMSFNYMITTDSDRDNCLLSDISIRDLRPNLDYTQDNDHVLYTWRDLDPYCGLNMNPLYPINVTPTPEDHGQPFPSTQDHQNGHSVFDGGTRPLGSVFDPPLRTTNKFGPENHEHDHGHDPQTVNGDGSEPPRPVSDGFEHGFDFFYPRKELSTFQRYTVNGHPCKNGTICQRNEIVGFWSCEIEESEYGSWDYCCEPNHRCGFSRGYHYPWCYVGSNEDQWRPCSETYYPYYLPKDQMVYRQLPANSARHWPIIYLHETLPPNCTIDNPNGSNRNHRLVRRESFYRKFS
ncbi:uncharacterized protein LOC143153150 isoform X4 [Ptiloglossa arizonensis]|uniref:uncharacterized protein LOC143153150 isoform X4 n=1 Tax=Ptiloglossa arizonensis TaxID=3350558 RepID=UPI003FA06DA3